MSEEERLEWDRRYREGRYQTRDAPFPLLAEWADRLPRGRALDIACGVGRNARFLAQAGYDVVGVDGSTEALRQGEELARSQGLNVEWTEANLDGYMPPEDTFAVAVNCFYLNRDLLPRLVRSLQDDGYLFMEQHLRTPLPVSGSPTWRVEPNEFLKTFDGLRILHYEELLMKDGDRDRDVAVVRLVACKGTGGF
jgi:SAM-dependent methyltransferase